MIEVVVGCTGGAGNNSPKNIVVAYIFLKKVFDKYNVVVHNSCGLEELFFQVRGADYGDKIARGDF